MRIALLLYTRFHSECESQRYFILTTIKVSIITSDLEEFRSLNKPETVGKMPPVPTIRNGSDNDRPVRPQDRKYEFLCSFYYKFVVGFKAFSNFTI